MLQVLVLPQSFCAGGVGGWRGGDEAAYGRGEGCAMPVQASRRPDVPGGWIDYGVREVEPGTDHPQQQDQQVGRFQVGGDDSTLLCPALASIFSRTCAIYAAGGSVLSS